LKEFVNIHGSMENSIEPENGPLSSKELHLIRGALELQEKTVTMVMTPLESVYMIEETSICDKKLLNELKNGILSFTHPAGHSRIPIYKQEKNNIIGYFLVKFLIGISPQDLTEVSKIKRYDAKYVQTTDELWTVFNEFIKGKNHLGFVKDDNNKVIGIITLEDIIEELLKEEIIDETDVYVDIQKKIRVVDYMKRRDSFVKMRSPLPETENEEITINLLN
jgi:metal transporter CNNM